MNREQIILLSKKNLRYMRNRINKKYYPIAKIAEICGVCVSTIRDRLKRYKIK